MANLINYDIGIDFCLLGEISAIDICDRGLCNLKALGIESINSAVLSAYTFLCPCPNNHWNLE